MGDLLLLFAAVAAAFLVDVAVFAAVRRAWPGTRRVLAHASGAAAALVGAALCLAASPLPPAWIAPAVAMIACNAYIGFHLDNMAETARRVRILRELDAAGALSRAEVLAAYSPREVFDRRIQRLLLAGQCVEEDGRLRLTGESYAAMGALVALGRRLVFGPSSSGRNNL